MLSLALPALPPADPRWRAASAAIWRGRYARALRLCGDLAADAASPEAQRSLAHSAAASALRQLGAAELAEPHDRDAHDLALVTSDAWAHQARADAAIGLAADAVAKCLGAAEVDVALARAADAVTVAGGWRVRTRLEWVRAESALLLDRDAVAPARAAVSMSEARSHRHLTKSRLILAVAHLHAGQPAAALAGLRAVAASPYPPLHWVVAVLLAERPSRGRWQRGAWRQGRAAAAGIARDLPEPLAAAFVSQPAVAALWGRAPMLHR